MGGAPGAGSLLLKTKASQEAVCSRAPAAIVPGQQPESHDAGVSRFAENGSHLAGADAAEGHTGLVDGPGGSEYAGIGSHLAAADAAEGHTGQVAFLRERMRTGRSDAGTSGKARHARHFPPENATNDTWQYVRYNSISTDETVFLSLWSGETRLCPDKSPMLRRANAHQLPVGRGHCLTKARCSLCRRGHKPNTCDNMSSPEKSLPMLNNK